MAGNGRRVVVAGAGLAGASAAWRLAGRGFEVHLLERNSTAGGRAGSSIDPESGEPIDTGQHALMGCYSSTLRWFAEMGTRHLVHIQDRLDVPFASNPAVRFRAKSLPAPLDLLGGIMALPGMDSASWLKALSLGRVVFAGRSLDKVTVSGWMDSLGLPVPLRKWVIGPLALAALNEQTGVGSAYPLARVMRRIGRRRGKWSALGWASAGLGDLYLGPVRNRVETTGGVFRTGAEINGIIENGGKVAGVRLSGGGEIRADAVVLALAPWDLGRVLEGVPSCASVAENAGKLKASPILTVHLWMDAGVLAGPFLGLEDGPFDWVFNRTLMVGTSPRSEHQGGENPWRGVQHVCLLRSGARELLGKKPVELEEMALECLRRAIPGFDRAGIVHRRIVWETRGTVSLVPGTDALRPRARTPVKGLVLAGGWTATGFPDTIESAVISGERAAASV